MAIPSLKIPVDLDMNGLKQQGQQMGSYIGDVLGDIKSQFESTNNNIASSTTGAFSQIGSGVAALTVGLTGATGASIALLAALGKVSAEVADIARAAQYLNTTTENFQALRFVGQTAGVSQEQSGKDLENVARLLNDAQRNENSLTKLLDANNVKYKDRNGQLVSMNDLLAKGSQLVANAGSYADKVGIAKMLGLTAQWVPELEKGADEFKRIADGAQAAGAIIDRETIAKAELFDQAWRSSASSITTQFKAAFIDVGSYVDDLVSELGDAIQRALDAKGTGDGQAKFNAIADALQIVERDANGAAQDLDQVNRVLENYRSKTNVDVEIVAALERIRDKAKQARDELAAVGQSAYEGSGAPLPLARPKNAGVPTNPTKIPERDTGTEGRDRFEAQADAIAKRTAGIEAETRTIDLNTAAREKARIAAQLQATAMQINKEAGLGENVVTAEQAATIERLATAYGNAAAAIERARSPLATFARDSQNLYKQLNDAGAQWANGMTDSLVGVVRGTKSVTDAFKSMADSIINDLLRIAIRKSITGPLADAMFSGLGSLFPSGSGALPGGAAIGQGGIGHAATGGNFGAGDYSIVGENGPELVRFGKSASVIPNNVAFSPSIAPASNGGFPSLQVNVINQSGVQMEASQGPVSKGPNGDLSTIVTLRRAHDAMNADLVSSGESQTNRIFEQRYGLTPRL